MSFDEFSQVQPDETNAGKFPARPPEPEVGVEVPWREIAPETLQHLVEAFVLREGTDYGEAEATITRKIADVMRQLERGEAKVVFDLTTETCSLVTSLGKGVLA